MAFADYLAGLNLDPGASARLQGMIGPPNDAPAQPVPMAPVGPADGPVNGEAPTPDEMAKYGAKPAEIQVAQAANSAPGAVNLANPSAQPGWTPEAQGAREGQARLAGVELHPPPVSEDDGSSSVAASAPGRYVAPHWQPGTRQEAIAYGMDPSHLAPAMSAADAAAGHGLAANDKRLEAAQQQGLADAVYSASHAAASQHAAQEMQRLDNEKKAYMAREQEKLVDLTTQAAAKVDPDAARGSAGAQILATIGVALGAFGSSITGGQNQALQIVTANIDRNIRAQETNIANSKQSLRDQQGLYKQNLEAFGDRERAVLATKMQYLEQVKAMGDQQYASAKHTMNEADKHEWDAKVMQQQAQYQTQFAQLTDDKRTTQGNEHYVPGQMVGGGGAAGAGPKGKEELFVPSLGVYARTKEEAVKLRDTSARTQNTVRELQEAQNIIAEAKNVNSPQKLAILQKRLDGVAARAAVTATVKEGQGAMSDGDRAVSEAGLGLQGISLGNLDRLNPMTPNLDQQAALVGRAIQAHQQEFGRLGSGAMRGKEVYVKDRVTGQMVPHQQLGGSNSPTRNKVDDMTDLIQAPVGQVQRAK